MENQICTNKKQSSRLLEAGVRPDTADCYLQRITETEDWSSDNVQEQIIEPWMEKPGLLDMDLYYPAWSLSKLIEILPATISQRNRPDLSLEITKDSVYWFIQYTELGYDCKHEVMEKNVLDAVVNMIEWLIKEGYLDKKFLTDKCGDCQLIEDEDANGAAWCSFHQKPTMCDSEACEDILEKGGSND